MCARDIVVCSKKSKNAKVTQTIDNTRYVKTWERESYAYSTHKDLNKCSQTIIVCRVHGNTQISSWGPV
jgi:hypothetical protein